MAASLPILPDDPGAAVARAQDKREGRTLSDAQRLMDAGRLDEARAVLAALGEQPTTRVRAQAALLWAGLTLMAGDAAHALVILARLPEDGALVVDSGSRDMLAAAALRQLRRYDEALARAERAAAAGASSGRLLVLADAQKHAGQLDAAVMTLQRLLTVEPTHATALAQLAGFLNLRADRAAADEAFHRFEAAAGADADAERGRAFFLLTRGDLDAALVCLARAMALEPGATRAYLADEVELDRWRSDARVGQLLASG